MVRWRPFRAPLSKRPTRGFRGERESRTLGDPVAAGDIDPPCPELLGQHIDFLFRSSHRINGLKRPGE